MRVLAWNVTGLSMDVAIGCHQTFVEADILLLTETWEFTGNALPTLAGFECLGSVFNHRRFNTGRGFGGIAIYIRSHLQRFASIEIKDASKQFLVMKLQTRATPSFLIAAYFAPLTMSVYEMGLADAHQPFHKLIQTIHEVQEQGEVWIAGDFNARVADQQFIAAEDLGIPIWSPHNHMEANWRRHGVDTKVNAMTPHFLELGAACGLRILNGVERFPHSSGFTFKSMQGCSTIDYLMASSSSAARVTEFRILDQQPESQHLPLLFHLNLVLPQRDKPTKQASSQHFFLDSEKVDIFRAEIEALLPPHPTVLELSQLVLKAAKQVFSRRSHSHKQKMKAWFDEECLQAREKAMAQPEDTKLLALRMYSNFIKHKKRCFMRQQQQVLYKEFHENPKLFWQRLKVRRETSCLDQHALLSFAESLYFFPEAARMPLEFGDAVQFSEEEVSYQLSRMQKGKAVDIQGLSLELLQWGGPHLVSSLTRGLNQVLTHGLPEDWIVRRLVPIHKEGSKEDVRNYRTIMVASIFAKVLGGLLEAKLSHWTESHVKRAPSQAGFREEFSTLDHILCLRVLGEKAKQLKKPLFCLFVDFSKAFDRVCRHKLWDRMVAIGVPLEMRVGVAQLYQQVRIKLSASVPKEVLSTLGVIQGCPLSPTLFGIFIDQLHGLLEEIGGEGVRLGMAILQLLIFADDVVLLAHNPIELQKHLVALEHFCRTSGMQVNMKKTKCISIGTRQEPFLYFEGQKVEMVTTYKYLGVQFSNNLSWASCAKSRVANGYKALYSMINKCRMASLSTWSLKRRLFTSLVRPVLLYGVQVWGAATSKSTWPKIEAIQKLFLEMELGVKSQTPYILTLAEAGLLPLEGEALLLTIKYVLHVNDLDASRLPKQALCYSRASGWYADVLRWAEAWGFPEHKWQGPPKALRKALQAQAIKKLWADPSPRLQYYLRDVTPMNVYEEQEYLRAPISLQLRKIIARYRLSSHHLAVEEGRWRGIERQHRTCRLCESLSIENEYHVFIACRTYHEVRIAHQILVQNLYDLFTLPPRQLGHYIMAIDRKRAEALGVLGTL